MKKEVKCMTKADIHHQDKRLEKALEKHLPKFNGDKENVKDFFKDLKKKGSSFYILRIVNINVKSGNQCFYCV
jgi:hypothetical protein